MAEELQGPNGPHRLQLSVNPLENNEHEVRDLEDRATGTAPALEDEAVE